MIAPRYTKDFSIVLVDPDAIRVDAATYQFRSGSDAQGITDWDRENAREWDPVLDNAPLLLHQRLDGTITVADGHHRLNRAKLSKASRRWPEKIAATVLREADGYTAEDVRVIAAYRNMARGCVDPIDGARVFKEAASGRVHTEFLPQLQMDKGNLRLTYRLSGLSDAALDKTAECKVPAEMAAYVADTVRDPVRQENIINLISYKLRQEYDPMPHNYEVSSPAKLPETPLGFAQRLLAERGQPNSITLH